MIRLALCITELNVGGAEQALCELAVRLDKERFAVEVYSLQARPSTAQQSCVHRLEAVGISVHFLGMRGSSESSWSKRCCVTATFSLFSGFFRLRELLRRQRPDVFLSFLFHANFLGRLAARSVGVRHIFSGIRVAERGKRLHLLLDRLTSSWVETYVCVSNSVAEFTRKAGKIPPNKIVVIPNGIEISTHESPSTYELFSVNAGRPKRIIFIGRLTHQKGLDWFFSTFPTWLQNLPDWEVWIVGEGEERQKLSNMLQKPEFDGIRERIVMTGWRADAAKLLAESRLLVLPSRWEGMPNVVLQAMAAGLPVVATAAEGVAELLGANTKLVEFGDTAALSNQILEMAQNEDLAANQGRKNFNRAVQHFQIETVVKQYEQLFENCRDQSFHCHASHELPVG